MFKVGQEVWERGKKCKEQTMKCEHKDYEIKQVMDFQFCVCKQCGFQWKGNKPSQPVNADAECQYANLYKMHGGLS